MINDKITIAQIKYTVPRWRNWQTRLTQNQQGFKPRAGSSPALGTKTKQKRWEISHRFFFLVIEAMAIQEVLEHLENLH